MPEFARLKENEMSNNTSSIVSKVWSFCNPLRDVGVGYGDYLEQLTYLLFLKMADEYAKPPHNRKLPIPNEYNWESLTHKKGAELELHYATLLIELSTVKGQCNLKRDYEERLINNEIEKLI